MNLLVREPAVKQKKVEPPAKLQNSSLTVFNILVFLLQEERLKR